MLIDTHAHLWWECYRDNLRQVLERAKSAGVEKIIVPGTNLASSKQAVALAKTYPGIIYAAVGTHPEDWQDGLPTRSDLEGAVAIGEIGTDASTDELKSHMGEQIELFRAQCEMALELDLPIIVHTRESLSETLTVMDTLNQMPKGIFHCFSGDEAGLLEVIKRGFDVSFGGNITWSRRVQKLITKIPIERLLLETDSPFMTPLSKKPEQNEPANVRITAQMIADLLGLTLEELGEQTTANAKALFKL